MDYTPELDVDQLYADIHNVAVAISDAIDTAQSRLQLAAALTVATGFSQLPREAHGLLVAELVAVQWQARHDSAEAV